jgi:hypothetical protein
MMQKRWLKFRADQPEKVEIILQRSENLEQLPLTSSESSGVEEKKSVTERKDEDASAEDTSIDVTEGLQLTM